MITHSEAKTIWRTIKNIEPSPLTGADNPKWQKIDKYLPHFPYRDTMINARNFGVVPAMVQIDLYFKHLTPETTKSYENVGAIWLEMVPYIPPARYSDTYKQLTEYFTQTKNYTPINVFTGAGI